MDIETELNNKTKNFFAHIRSFNIPQLNEYVDYASNNVDAWTIMRLINMFMESSRSMVELGSDATDDFDWDTFSIGFSESMKNQKHLVAEPMRPRLDEMADLVIVANKMGDKKAMKRLFTYFSFYLFMGSQVNSIKAE